MMTLNKDLSNKELLDRIEVLLRENDYLKSKVLKLELELLKTRSQKKQPKYDDMF